VKSGGRRSNRPRQSLSLRLRLWYALFLARPQNSYPTLEPPLAPPHMTPQAVVAEAASFCQSISGRPFRLQYGSYHDWSTKQRTTDPDGTTRWHSLPRFDAWTITVTGLSLPRPGGRREGSAHRPPPISAVVIVIDDKTGKYYAAHGA
jgi:hypothetical protein